ncbi:hypothetical protein ARC23_04095 [Stenotrophomonas beteli]|uniref:Transmembrane protein n=1 Tax=Stenotrophomonas beteli TaxID=3384461 RepID=A0A0R0B606_9GAMM|nr:hypothetical protein ARC23_04095 [Stenotrophomonas maltophilia]
MAEPLYCYPFQILCQPLSWWSSAASWAQALLSALAILGASYIAKKQHERVKVQQIGAICGTVQMAADHLIGYRNVIRDKATTCLISEADRRRLDVISTALSSTPIHEIPDHRLAIWMFTVGEIVAQAADAVGQLPSKPSPDDVKKCVASLDIYVNQASDCLKAVREIDKQYSGR